MFFSCVEVQDGLILVVIDGITILLVRAVTAFHNMEYGVTFIKLRERSDTYTYISTYVLCRVRVIEAESKRSPQLQSLTALFTFLLLFSSVGSPLVFVTIRGIENRKYFTRLKHAHVSTTSIKC